MRLKLNTTSSFIVPFHIHFKLIVYKKTGEWQQVVQRVTANDNKWQRMTTSGTTSDNEWQRVTKSDNEGQWVTASESSGTVKTKRKTAQCNQRMDDCHRFIDKKRYTSVKKSTSMIEWLKLLLFSLKSHYS